MPAKFITPPNKLPDNDRRKLLIVDADWHDMEAVAVLCMTRNVNLDFYIFGPTSIDIAWLENAAGAVGTILLNNKEDTDRHSELKEELGKLDSVVSLGAANDLHMTPLDYIVTILKKKED